MIVVVDTGGANLASVMNALARLGREAELSSEPERIQRASHVILPGVGAAGHAMGRLRERGLVPLLRALTQPVLGICLGMQLLFERSEEDDTACLGVLPGVITALTPDPARGITVPHMGWNGVTSAAAPSLLVGDLAPGTYFYFVHTYRAPEGPYVRATTVHGGSVVAAVEDRNFFGVQFHPERSGTAGAALLARFLSL